MPPSLAIAVAPPDGVYRVSRNTQLPFDPPPWERAGRERFDYPTRPLNPDPQVERGFRMIYCATHRTVAYREVLAGFRPNVRLIQELRYPNESDQLLVRDLVDGVDVHEGIVRGVVPKEWRWLRHIGRLTFPDPPACANLAEPDSWAHLMTVPAIQKLVLEHGFDPGLDLNAVTSRHRPLTQACAVYIHGLVDHSGTPRFAGIKYRSRFGSETDWECWAFFDRRLSRVQAGDGRSILIDDLDLLQAARTLNLTLEDDFGEYRWQWRNVQWIGPARVAVASVRDSARPNLRRRDGGTDAATSGRPARPADDGGRPLAW